MWVEEFALFKKEFLYFRGKIPFLVIATFFLLNSLFLVLMWPPPENTLHAGNKIFKFFLLTIFSFFILSNLFIAGISAVSFTHEKEQGTYELLQSTLIPPWKFFLAKMMVIFFYILVLFATLLPVYVLGLMIGGIHFSQVLQFFGITFSTCLLNALFAIFASISLNISTDAVRRAYFAAFFCMGGFSLAGHFFILSAQFVLYLLYGGYVQGYFPQSHQEWLSISNPFYSLYQILYPSYRSMLFGFLPRWAVAPVAYIFISFLFLPLIIRKIYLTLSNRPLVLRKANKLQKFLPPEKKPWLVHFLVQKTANAIFQKELCTQFYFKTRSFSWAVLVMFGLMFGLNYVCVASNFDFALLAVVELISFGFVTIGIASTIITKEIENEDFNLIRSTLITPFQFVVGKFQSLAWGLSLPIFICCICNYLYVIGRFKQAYSLWEKFLYISIYNLELLFVFYITLILSMMAGVLVKRTIGASLLAYLINFFFYGGIVFIIFATGISRNLYLLAFSPFSAIVMFWTNELSVKNIYLHLFYLLNVFVLSFAVTTQVMKQKRWIDS